MNILLVVNDSPWGSTLSITALRLARAMLSAGHSLDGIFFRGEGVYNAVGATTGNPASPDLKQAWSTLADDSGAALMLCQSSVERRLESRPDEPFRGAGLAELIDRMATADRVVTL